MEPWVEDIIKAIAGKNVIIVDSEPLQEVPIEVEREVTDPITDDEIKDDLEKYRMMAKELGASGATVIPAEKVHVDKRVRIKCIIPKCPEYGGSAQCPPHTMEHDKMSELVQAFKYALLVKLEIQTSVVVGEDFFMKDKDGKIYQFVAANMGSGETVEGQITGKEKVGGIQLIVYDPKEGKNLVGAFYQPRLVLSDVRLLKTLPRRQLCSGMAEVIKYAIIRDPKLFSYLEKHLPEILSAKDATLQHIINASSRIKAGVVAKDEREERGIRTILNFGHTVGHAIEAASGYRGYTHGEAIALGMLVASRISCERGLINPATLERIRALIQKAGLPTIIRKTPLKAIIKAHYRDKKFIGARNRFVLIAGIGKTKIVENIPLPQIASSIKRYLTSHS
jgi:hypothetical protein